ncbi:MAG: hypothetical protein QOH49_3884 [Acidobacteriota bacterium]|jgi:phenylacetate-CoA ligase|nr:hypothetical protein [Acidobacteriota bacterium]
MGASVNREAIYSRLPVSLQNAVCGLVGWQTQRRRYAEGFRRALGEVEGRTHLSRDELRAYQERQLRSVLTHCAKFVPYYRRKFCEWGVDPERVRTAEDLSNAVPVLTKDEVKANAAEFVSEGISRSEVFTSHTSGTTGGGLRFASTREASDYTWAYWWRYRRWHGLELGTWSAHFGGRSVVPVSQTRPPFWRKNLFGRQILFSAYHASPMNLGLYMKELERTGVAWLHGYPSVLALLAERALNGDTELRGQIKWITTGAENLLPQQSRLIECAFGVAPVQHYGQAEGVANISQCPAGRLHVDEDFSLVEFLPAEGQDACRIVGTGFLNLATPLLRYDTQDLAEPDDPSAACDCGRHGRLIRSLDGRREDYVVLKSGALVGRLDHIFKDLVNIREAQIFQNRPGEVLFRIVRGSGYQEGDQQQLLTEAQKRLGIDAEINVEYVEEIKRTGAGKLRLVISELPEGMIVQKVKGRHTSHYSSKADSH